VSSQELKRSHARLNLKSYLSNENKIKPISMNGKKLWIELGVLGQSKEIEEVDQNFLEGVNLIQIKVSDISIFVWRIDSTDKNVTDKIEYDNLLHHQDW